MNEFFIHYLTKRNEVYFKFYESPHLVQVKDKQDAIEYLERFYEFEKKRLESFKSELDKFKLK